MTAITYVIDTREQKPYEFTNSESVSTVHRKLDAGDYSAVGYENVVAVERKSLDDFAQTVIRDWDRFHRELKKLQTYKAACIVVEASIKDIVKNRYRVNAVPNSVIGRAMSICVDYNIPLYFLNNRAECSFFVEHWIGRQVFKIEKERVIG